MESALKLWRNHFAVIIFCMASTVLLMINNNLNKLLLTTKTTVLDEDILYEKEVDYQSELVFSYAQIIAELIIGQDYDIQIGNIIIPKDNFNYMQFNYNVIPICKYKQQIVYDINGEIKKINYTAEVE